MASGDIPPDSSSQQPETLECATTNLDRSWRTSGGILLFVAVATCTFQRTALGSNPAGRMIGCINHTILQFTLNSSGIEQYWHTTPGWHSMLSCNGCRNTVMTTA